MTWAGYTVRGGRVICTSFRFRELLGVFFAWTGDRLIVTRRLVKHFGCVLFSYTIELLLRHVFRRWQDVS